MYVLVFKALNETILYGIMVSKYRFIKPHEISSMCNKYWQCLTHIDLVFVNGCSTKKDRRSLDSWTSLNDTVYFVTV